MSIKEQFVKDIKTDELLCPSKLKRYTSYAVAVLAIILFITGVCMDNWRLIALSINTVSLIVAWYGAKAYRYIQHKENKQK